MEEMRFRMANYDGGLPSHPTPEPKGRLVLTPSGTWALEFAGGFRKSAAWIRADFVQHPFEVTETGPGSCHVTIRDTQDPAISAGFDLPLTPASGLRKALAGYVTAALTAQERSSAIQRGPQIQDTAQWWEGITPHTLLRNCHYDGERQAGTLGATGVGIDYNTRVSRVHWPWSDIANIEILESNARDGRSARIDVARVVRITDKRGQPFQFVPEDSSAAAMAPVVAIIERMRTTHVAHLPAPSAIGPTLSVADELAKLAQLRDAGVLTEEEFAAQKARLLA